MEKQACANVWVGSVCPPYSLKCRGHGMHGPGGRREMPKKGLSAMKSREPLCSRLTPKFRQNKRKTGPQPEIFLSFSVSMSVKMVAICHIYRKVGARCADQMADRPRFLRHVCQYMYGESKNHWYKSIPESIHF